MKISKALAIFALAFFATPLFAADPPSVVGRLNHISGPVSFAPADANEDWGAATLNRPITTGDRLWADSGARAEMHVGSAAIRMAQQTSLDVLNIDDRSVQLRLAQGSVNVRLRNLPRDSNFEIDTPHGAVLLTRPGSYRVDVPPSGAEATVAVRSGQADVLTSESRFTVQSNQQARVTGPQAPSFDIVAGAPMDEFDRWAAARDQREDRLAATRYVPPEMTGYEDLDEYGSWRTVPEYGGVWVPAGVPVGWAPYRYGHWVWISPWGWTWVDDAPWGFAPFHYGRWVWVGSYWAWAPGPVAVRPVYAPALVAFIGGANFSVAIGVGSTPAVAWVPLGWREPFVPWYRTSPTYVRNVNVAHVRNINVTNINVTNINYVNRSVPSGVTVARRQDFVSARRIENLKVSSKTLTGASVTAAAPVRAPERASFAPSRSGPKPPADVVTREVVAAKAPPAERPGVARGDRGPAVASRDERPRVRVVSPQRESAQAAPPAAEAERRPQPERGKGPERGKPPTAQAPVEAERGQPQAERGKGREPEAKPQPQARPQPERKAPAPPPEVSKRPTFDRDQRATTPAPPSAEAPRPQQQVEREGARNGGRENAPPRAQPRPQPEPRVQAPPPQVEREVPRGRVENGPPQAQPRPQPERRQAPPPAAERPAPQAQPRPEPERRQAPPPAVERRAPPGPPPQAQAPQPPPSVRPAPHPEPRREAPRPHDGNKKQERDNK